MPDTHHEEATRTSAEHARERATDALAHCERQRSYLAPEQVNLIDGRTDFQLARDVIALADALAEAERRAEQAERAHVNCPSLAFVQSLADANEANAERVAGLQAQLDAYEEAVALIDSPYPIGVFPDLQERDAVFAAMRAVNKFATEQFYAETARQRGEAVRQALAVRGVREPDPRA